MGRNSREENTGPFLGSGRGRRGGGGGGFNTGGFSSSSFTGGSAFDTGRKRTWNGLKTAGLLGGMWALLLGIGWLLASGTGSSMYLWLFAGIGLISTAYSYWNSDKIALKSMQARPVSEAEFPWLYQTVRELSDRAGKPMPRLYVSPTSSPNAFATGRNPENSAVCVTEGILHLLSERELRAVIGHELMHVYNRDILTSSVAAAMAGIITSLAQFALFFGGGRQRNGNPLVMLLMVFLAPIASMVIQLAISRTREYDADHDGALLTEDPMALPPMADRIARLEELAGYHR